MLGNFRIGLAGAHPSHEGRSTLEDRAACNLANGDLYTYPARDTPAIDGTQPLTFTWNTDCTVGSSVDLYLYAPSAKNGVAHAWTGIDFSSGKFTTTLQPKWWNSTTTAILQVAILQSGAPSWMTTSPPGPVFTVNYPESAMFSTTAVGGTIVTSTAAAAAVQSTDAVFENVSSTQKAGGISKGAIAAAVIVPILVLIVVAGVAVKFWRNREAEKRRRWSQAMSSHSNLEWEKGALPGDKPQSILGRPSMSSYMGGGGRAASMATSSIYATENMAGAGAVMGRPPFAAHYPSQSADNLNRSSVMLPDGNVRQSRISFAETARPDRRSRLSLGGDLRPAVQSGIWKLPIGSRSANDLNTPLSKKHAAYATGSAIADDDDEDINISPSQLQGPHAFAEAEMRRVGGVKRTGRKSILSLGGSRRESVVSHLSADDFKSAASARGSVDELRDIEATLLARRSVLSQHSAAKSSPDLRNSPVPWSNNSTPNLTIDTNAAETLAQDDSEGNYSLPAVPPPSAGSSTVAYGPDQMLAVYAARGKVASSPAPSTSVPSLGKKQGIRILTGLGKKGDTNEPSSAGGIPASASVSSAAGGEMKSYVHLNKGTASSAAVEAMPAPGPPTPTTSSLRIPVPGRQRSGTMTMHSDASAYSEEGDVGKAT